MALYLLLFVVFLCAAFSFGCSELVVSTSASDLKTRLRNDLQRVSKKYRLFIIVIIIIIIIIINNVLI